jgi:hypothetical protein
VRLILEPRVDPQAVLLVNLGLLAVLLAALMALLAFLLLYFLPAPLTGELGIACTHTRFCPHTLPLWGQFALWLPAVSLALWLLWTVGGTLLSGGRSSRRIRRLALTRGERMDDGPSRAVYRVDDARVFACVAGIFRPVVVVSSSMAKALVPSQLEIVIAHEEAHAKRRHNLALLAARAAERSLFFIPGVRAAGRSVRRSVEAIADDAAAAKTGDALSVAEAVTRVAGLAARGVMPRGAVDVTTPAFASEDLAVQRVERLLFGIPRAGGRLRLLSSVVAVALLLLVFTSTGYAIGTSGFTGGSQAAVCYTDPAE